MLLNIKIVILCWKNSCFVFSKNLSLFATNKLHLSHVAIHALVGTHAFSRRCRLVAPFPLKVLRLSGTPESPPDFLGRGKARKQAYILARAKMKRGGLCFDDVQLRVTQSLRFGSVCPFWSIFSYPRRNVKIAQTAKDKMNSGFCF